MKKKIHLAQLTPEETEREFKETRWAPTICGMSVRSRGKITQDGFRVTCLYCKKKISK